MANTKSAVGVFAAFETYAAIQKWLKDNKITTLVVEPYRKLVSIKGHTIYVGLEQERVVRSMLEENTHEPHS